MAHLYAMCRSDAPGVIKVGRSDDPTRRAHELQAGHFFAMTVLARVEHAGPHERAVHAALQDRRIQGPGPGIEWFRCSLGEVLVAIGHVLGTSEEEEEDDAEMDDEMPSPFGGSMISKQYASQLRCELERGTTKGGRPLTEEVVRSHLAKLKARALCMSERYRLAELAWIAEVERSLDTPSVAGEAGEA